MIMIKALRATYLIIRIIAVISFYAAIVWIARNPDKVGEWYAKWQKGQLTEFYKR
jgi:hypothetical protein